MGQHCLVDRWNVDLEVGKPCYCIRHFDGCYGVGYQTGASVVDLFRTGWGLHIHHAFDLFSISKRFLDTKIIHLLCAGGCWAYMGANCGPGLIPGFMLNMACCCC